MLGFYRLIEQAVQTSPIATQALFSWDRERNPVKFANHYILWSVARREYAIPAKAEPSFCGESRTVILPAKAEPSFCGQG
jgi:hypothetical protein